MCKKRITGLKSSLRATEKYAYCLDYPQDMAFQSQTPPYPFTLKKKKKTEMFEIAVLASRTGKRNQVLQFDVCCKAIDQLWLRLLYNFALLYQFDSLLPGGKNRL